jgi:hypothetical protein
LKCLNTVVEMGYRSWWCTHCHRHRRYFKLIYFCLAWFSLIVPRWTANSCLISLYA